MLARVVTADKVARNICARSCRCLVCRECSSALSSYVPLFLGNEAAHAICRGPAGASRGRGGVEQAILRLWSPVSCFLQRPKRWLRRAHVVRLLNSVTLAVVASSPEAGQGWDGMSCVLRVILIAYPGTNGFMAGVLSGDL